MMEGRGKEGIRAIAVVKCTHGLVQPAVILRQLIR